MRSDCQLQMLNVQSCVYESCSRGKLLLTPLLRKRRNDAVNNYGHTRKQMLGQRKGLIISYWKICKILAENCYKYFQISRKSSCELVSNLRTPSKAKLKSKILMPTSKLSRKSPGPHDPDKQSESIYRRVTALGARVAGH